MKTLMASPSIRPRIPQPLRLVAIGDSLVYGYGDPQGGGWVERLRRFGMDPAHPGPILYNLGVRGDGVQQVLKRMEQEFHLRGELRNRLPDGIILSVGVNDSARLSHHHGKTFTSLPLFTQTLHDLLDQARQWGPVWFVGMVPVNESKMPFLDCLYYNHQDQVTYNQVIQDACTEREIPFLDLFHQWQQHGEAWCQRHLSADGLHPNSAGYQVIQQAVMRWPALHSLWDYPTPSCTELAS